VIVKDAAEFDWTQAQLAFFAAGAKPVRRMSKMRPTPGVWLSISAACLRWSRTYRWWCRT
jgi:hypothetical protein